MNRRKFSEVLGLGSLGAAVAAIGVVAASDKHPVPLREIETVRVGEELSEGIDRVYLNGREVRATAFNKAEGWADIIDTDRIVGDAFDMARHFGAITYTTRKS